ncbi:carbon monoxide dehydrogenase maturation protein [Amycolatopsis sp. FBCC-B4732]|uniref:carbon monoxide dehydrogenase maturation protein n=1 Tax=Amycolatopsis sp. FBCC-B4732 TaxID=3079339 RepID=UPI001FF22935|nr:carbon monoxide dehydrogenase maturation protein [Amycolatopsis sp. FBCC-B4732]UOX88399.1 carbon monoxide dehydrogenase maturation protein [Amycolatopsis sp. FBCC-B4732]
MLIALASVKGSPGVTTFALALAASWPAGVRRVVVECDPAGGDLAQRFGLAASPGLLSLAAVARQPVDPDVVWSHTQPLSGGLQAMPGPPGGQQARAALSTLASPSSPLYGTARQPTVVLFADCGRLDPGSPAEAVIRHADVLLLLSGTYSDELAHLATRAHELGHTAARACLVLAGHGHPTHTVERELGIPVMARIPHDPSAAARYTGRAAAGRRRTGGLVRVASDVAQALFGDFRCEPAPPIPDLVQQVPGVPAQHTASSGVRVLSPDLHNGRPQSSSPGKDVRS